MNLSHYRLWSIDGDYSIYKIRENTNYEAVDSPRNAFTAKFSEK
jgi:hypothetical protein